MAAAQLAMEPMPMLAMGPMPMLAMGPMLAFWLRPSTCAGAHGAALQSTVPMLVLPHDRVDAFAKKLHDSELLLPVSLGESSKARKSERHPASALTATPHLRALYQHMRSGESSAWVFFCSPSLCEPTLLRALSIYYFLWNEVQDLLTHMKHDRDGHMLAQLRQSKGPSFIFMPRDTNPLHHFLAHIPVEPAALVALEKCATDPTYRAKLLEQPAAMDLTPRVEEWTPESAATAVGRELYKRQLAAVAPKTRGDSS